MGIMADTKADNESGIYALYMRSKTFAAILIAIDSHAEVHLAAVAAIVD